MRHLLRSCLVVLVAGTAQAADLRICWSDASTASMAKVSAQLGTVATVADLLPGSTVSAGVRCSETPIVTTWPRNVDHIVTLRAVNALGEVSAPSNGVPFRLPSAPPVPSNVTVSIIAGP